MKVEVDVDVDVELKYELTKHNDIYIIDVTAITDEEELGWLEIVIPIETHLDVVIVNYADTGCYAHYHKEGRTVFKKIPYRMWEHVITHDEVSAVSGITEATVDIVRFKDEFDLINTINRFRTYKEDGSNNEQRPTVLHRAVL